MPMPPWKEPTCLWFFFLTEEINSLTFPAMSSTDLVETFPVPTPAASLVFTTALSQGPLSRAEIARRTGLSSAAVTKAVRPLMATGYVVEDADGSTPPAVGRPANPVRVNGGRALFIGVKVTADEVIAVLADLCCRLRVVRHVPLHDRTPDTVISAIATLTGELVTEAQAYGVGVRGLAVAVSGDVDRAAGVVRYSPFLDWRNVALAGLARSATGLPTTVDNDVRALAVAEQWFGAGSGAPTSRWSRSGPASAADWSSTAGWWPGRTGWPVRSAT